MIDKKVFTLREEKKKSIHHDVMTLVEIWTKINIHLEREIQFTLQNGGKIMKIGFSL